MGSCRFIIDHWVQRKGETIKMKVIGITDADGDKLKSCVYQCQLSSGKILMFPEEELDHWDDTPTTEVFVDTKNL